MSEQLEVWKEDKSLEEIKKIFAPNLTDGEFKTFVGMGKATSLNPFLKEIWAVKYKEGIAAQIFIARDGYRKSAQRHPQYDYHYVESVYSNDMFDSNDGDYKHAFNLKDRGQLVGAFCKVKRKDSSKSMSVFVELKEYLQKYENKKTLWDSKPSTMIKKVAESQGLRMGFQELFSGTYEESEFGEDELSQNNSHSSKKKPKPELPELPHQQQKIENMYDEGIVIDSPVQDTPPQKFGESREDKKLIFEKATQISSAFSVEASKNEELIKNICRAALTKDITEKSVDMIISQLFYDVKKNRPEEIII